MTLEKDFTPYEQALELKNLGFNEECLDKYIPTSKKLNSDMDTWGEHYPETLMIPAPLYQQAFRWFREKHGLYSIIFKHYDDFAYQVYAEKMQKTEDRFNIYEEAELACLKKLIEIVKNK